MRFSYTPGSTPLDGFTIEQGIGIGGFGEVYRAVTDVGKRVALKKIIRNLDIELRGVKQCINLKHVNLISLWDIKTDSHGESWVVMEYVPGPSLRDVVHAHPNGLPEDEVKRWFVSTASGVAYLHQQDIVHRDLKPGNIFLDEETQVIKIGDYGLSKFMNTSRRSGQTEAVGTFHYMAPEIGRGVYGREIDIYALGIILFEILTGEVPFDGESTQEIIMKHLTDDPKLDRVPAGFRKAIRDALQKDPELRYHSIPEMLADLPWPDIAENCQRIISINAVGPLSSGSRARPLMVNSPAPDPFEVTNDHLSAMKLGSTVTQVNQRDSWNDEISRSNDDVDVIGDDQVQVIELSRGADIVFGPLKDLSQAGPESTEFSTPYSGSKNNNLAGQSSSPLKNHENGSAHTGTISPYFTSNDQPRYGSARTGQNPGKGELTRLPRVEIVYPENGTYHAAGTLPQGANEPIARSVQQGMMALANWWNYGNVSTPIKVLVLVVISLTLVLNSAWLLPVATCLGVVYLGYYFLRTWWLGDTEIKGKQISQKEMKRAVLEEIRGRLRARPVSQRVFELLGSLVIAVLACSVLSLLGLAIGSSAFHATKELWQAYGWMALTSIFASCSLLLVSKFWEDRPGETVMRRFTMILLGVLVGGFSYLMANAFSVNLADGAQFGSIDSPNSKVIIKGLPMLPAYMVYYAALFGILRWWMQTDPVRSTRLSILSVSFCLVWACLFSVMLELPFLPNCILAVVISIALQLASPWRSEVRMQV
jgi:serine/threonine protein kinase